MLTPTLSRFLSETAGVLRSRDADKLCQYLVIEPPYPQIYEQLRAEIRSTYNAQDRTALQRLETVCSDQLSAVLTDPEGNAPTWTAFTKFMAQYFIFLRDVDVSNLLATYELLSEVLQKANSALTHSSSGVLLLPTVVSYSRMLSRLAIGLDKQPHLIAHLIPRTADTADGGTRETLPERAANILRNAFVTCLNDRSGTNATGLDAQGRPAGKKRGIYTIANQCLKILFQCGKIRGAAQIFENIYNQSPPLSAFPKSERVTYLYYLGRFNWANGHVFRAQAALQHAWDHCHVRCERQLRLIAVYLIASNLACGRFPTRTLLDRVPDLRPRFAPLCLAIRAGDLVAFRTLLRPGGAGDDSYAFFARYHLDLGLASRCEPFVWRSLVRRTFLASGDPGDPAARKAPSLDLARLLERWAAQESQYGGTEGSLARYVDEDFLDESGNAIENTRGRAGFDMTDVYSRLSSLIHQELVNGYLSYRLQKLAIQGARQKGAVAGGFPTIWQVLSARAPGGNEVPGWKLEGRSTGGVTPLGGQVINLSGARPVGVA